MAAVEIKVRPPAPAYGQSLRFFHDRKAKALTTTAAAAAADRTSEGVVPAGRLLPCRNCPDRWWWSMDGDGTYVLLERQVRVDIYIYIYMELVKR